jgi:hypothetical protein
MDQKTEKNGGTQQILSPLIPFSFVKDFKYSVYWILVINFKRQQILKLHTQLQLTEKVMLSNLIIHSTNIYWGTCSTRFWDYSTE